MGGLSSFQTVILILVMELLLSQVFGAKAYSIGNVNNTNPRQSKVDDCNCGLRNYGLTARIVGGNDTDPNEFPWRCFLGTRDYPYCGCSLISDEWVMTAAHCTDGIGKVSITLGAHDLEQSSGATVVTSKQILIHPNFDPYEIMNDIALIKLDHPVRLTREISPVCLPWESMENNFSGENAVTSGWGRTSFGAPASKILQKVNLPVMDNKECDRIYGKGWVTADMICAFESGKGTCNGDSGSSMDLEVDDRYFAIGITSWGDKYCQAPSVFARVTHFLKWIQSTTNENFCKA